MRVVIARTMSEFSMNVYTDGIISGLRAVRPHWEIVDMAPHSVDRKSRSLFLRIWKYYERFWQFPHTIRQQTADIFHIIDPAEAHIAYWFKNTNTPVVVTCHDLINFFYPDNLQGSVQLPLISKRAWLYAVKGMQHANHVLAISSVTAKDITKIVNIPPASISIIPNAVASTFQQLPKSEIESFRQQQELSPQTILLLNVGSNHPRKNISTILKVINSLQSSKLSIHFCKIGADFTLEQKKFIKAQGIEKHITYLGKSGKSTLVKFYNAADILIAPSLHEGFGMTVLEAMACGTPVITSNVSSLPEVAGDAAVLVDPTNVKAIADAICHIQSDSDFRQQLIDKGLARVKEFTWERTAEQMAVVYEKLIASNQRSNTSN